MDDIFEKRQSDDFSSYSDDIEDDEIILDESLDEGEFSENIISEYQWYGSGWVNKSTGYILSSYDLSENMSVILNQLGISENST